MQTRDSFVLETAPSLKSEHAQPAPDTGRTEFQATSEAEQKKARENALELAIAVARAADAKKAEDIVILDVSSTLGIADFFVIASARSRRQLAVVAEGCAQMARGLGSRPRAIEGAETGWVVADFVDVVLHVFEEQARGFYDLEHLWADAPRMEWTPETPAHAAGLHDEDSDDEDSDDDDSDDEDSSDTLEG